MRDFVKFDASETLERAIEAFEEESGEILFAGDERRMMINSFMYLAEIIMNEINYRANNNFIATCDEETLFEKAIERNCERIQSQKASVTVRFFKSGTEAVVVPKGTRVTGDGILFFQTDYQEEIKEDYADIKCIAVDSGGGYNDMKAGAIHILVDTIPYITKIESITDTSGGSDIEDIEKFRERVLNAPKAYSTAGAKPAYIAKVKEVSQEIEDVILINENTNIKIYILLKNGKIPEESFLEKIRKHITDESVRTFTDNVYIFPAEKKEYEIIAAYKIEAEREEEAETIKQNIEKALKEYEKMMYTRMGKTINPEEIRRYLYNAGAASVTMEIPETIIKLQKTQVAILKNSIVTYEGVLQ